jgi:Uma2 family endonuclease
MIGSNDDPLAHGIPLFELAALPPRQRASSQPNARPAACRLSLTAPGRYVSLDIVNKVAALGRLGTAEGFTAADFLRMLEIGAFDDARAELVGGVIEKMMPSLFTHGECNARLVAELVQAYRGSSRRVAVDLVVQIDEATVRAADVAVVNSDIGRRAAVAEDLILVVEIADTTLARDLGEKLLDYARAGVPSYWVVDLEAKAVRAMAGAGPQGYAETRIVQFGDQLGIPGTDRAIVLD